MLLKRFQLIALNVALGNIEPSCSSKKSFFFSKLKENSDWKYTNVSRKDIFKLPIVVLRQSHSMRFQYCHFTRMIYKSLVLKVSSLQLRTWRTAGKDMQWKDNIMTKESFFSISYLFMWHISYDWIIHAEDKLWYASWSKYEFICHIIRSLVNFLLWVPGFFSGWVGFQQFLQLPMPVHWELIIWSRPHHNWRESLLGHISAMCKCVFMVFPQWPSPVSPWLLLKGKAEYISPLAVLMTCNGKASIQFPCLGNQDSWEKTPGNICKVLSGQDSLAACNLLYLCFKDHMKLFHEENKQTSK